MGKNKTIDKNKNNQLFKEIPPLDFVTKILLLFIPNGIDTNYTFSRQDIEDKKVIEKINIYIPELENYYLKCKRKKYLLDLNPKKIITLLRQILRPHNHKVIAREKYSFGKKYLLYHLEEYKNCNKKEYNLTIDFS